MEDLEILDDEDLFFNECPQCGRDYDEVGYDLQWCKKCGWDAERERYERPLEPTDEDFINGDADILTGKWY